jgi:ribosomal protein S18 acetylase RimI-like enzyme
MSNSSVTTPLPFEQHLLEPRHFDAVREIYFHESAVPFLSHDVMSAEEFANVLREYAERRTFRVFESGAEVVGFLNVTRGTGRTRHVTQLGPFAIKATVQGTGVGHTIMEALVEELRQEGVRRVELVAEVDNPRAIRFYQRHGFEIEGTMRAACRRAYEQHDTDSYLMSLLVDK